MALHKLEMERELAKYRDHLEEVVAERTAELKETNEQFWQSQKMESIGRLAGGIAHDFNNLLTPILGYAELGMAKLPPGDVLSTNFEEILKAAGRASQLLSFSRRRVIEPKVIDLNDLLFNVDKMLRRLIGEDIELVILTADFLSLVEADAGSNLYFAGKMDNPLYQGDFRQALGAIKAKAIIMPSQTDQYFPPEDSEIEARQMPKDELRVIPSIWGHLAGGPGRNPADTQFIDKNLIELLAS